MPLTKIKMNQNTPLNYQIGEVELKKNESYIIQTPWAKQLNCEQEKFEFQNYRIDTDLTDKSILIIRTMGLGDLLFLSPVVQLIKEKYPTCKIGFTTINEHQVMLDLIPNIDKVHTYPILTSEIEKYDHIFQVSGLIESGITANVYEVYLSLLGIDIEKVDKKYLKPIIKKPILDNIDKHNKLIGIHPFAYNKMRQLNHLTVDITCRQLIENGYDIIIFSNQNEYNQYSKFYNSDVKWAIRSVNNMVSTTRLLASCKKVFATDSVILHLAQACGIPTICLFGPILPESRIHHYTNITCIDTQPSCRCNGHKECKFRQMFSPCITIDPAIITEFIMDDDFILTQPKIYSPETTKYNMKEEINVEETIQEEE